MKSPIEYLYWWLQWKTSIDINIYSKFFLILNHHNEVSYWILLLKTPAKDFTVNCHLKDDFNYNRLCSTMKRKELLIYTHVLLRNKDSFQNRTVHWVWKTQHIVLDTKGNPFFVNKSGNTIIIVEYTFVMMSYALTYLKYFLLTIQVREECDEVIPGEEELLKAGPIGRGTSYSSRVQTQSQTTAKTDLLSGRNEVLNNMSCEILLYSFKKM